MKTSLVVIVVACAFVLASYLSRDKGEALIGGFLAGAATVYIWKYDRITRPPPR